MYERDLYPALADASIEHPEDFPERVLQILCDSFPLRAATWYSFRAGSTHLILRGQYGLDYHAYKSFELPLETLPGQAAQSGEIVTSSDISQYDRYRNIDLISRYGLKALVAVPLLEKGDESVKVRGVLCLYPREEHGFREVAQTVGNYLPFILRLYHAALGRRRILWRKRIVEKAGYAHDMLGLLYRLTLILRDLVGAEAATIFRWNPKNEALCPLGTTGLEQDGQRLSAKEVRSIFLFEGSTDPTYLAFKNRTLALLEDVAQFAAFDRERGFEKLESSSVKNALLVPLIEAASAATKERNALGVARILNRKQILSGVSHVTSFGWEELHLIAFYAEVTSLMIHFLSRGEDALTDFTRCMHATKNNLHAARHWLELLEMSEIKLPEKLHHALSDSLAFLNDVCAQVSRVELKHEYKLKLSEVKIYGEVLAKIVAMTRRSARTQRIDNFVVDIDDKTYNEPSKFPTVLANRDALLCVFRNLADNAIKYCDLRRKEHHLKFSYERIKFEKKPDMFRIVVRDNGIGIMPKDLDMIFVEGYRSKLAIQRHPDGSGFGLADCRELLHAMGGGIECEIDDGWTVFTVDIPTWSKV